MNVASQVALLQPFLDTQVSCLASGSPLQSPDGVQGISRSTNARHRERIFGYTSFFITLLLTRHVLEAHSYLFSPVGIWAPLHFRGGPQFFQHRGSKEDACLF
jgi:hypothetical protein